jgi:PBP1b-binding outer membrane lipoprotein LpoB
MRNEMKKITCSVAITFFAFFISGCSGPLVQEENHCNIVVPDHNITNKKAAVEAALDLKAFAAAPISGNLKTDFSTIIDSTFQKVPDKIAACAMLNQTYTCIQDERRASAYLNFVRETQQCSRQ